MSTIQVDEAVAQAKRLDSLFERRMITESSLISGIAELVTPESFHDVLGSLSAQVRGLVRDWAKSLPDENCEVIYWPLKREVRLCFKEWLQDKRGTLIRSISDVWRSVRTTASTRLF